MEKSGETSKKSTKTQISNQPAMTVTGCKPASRRLESRPRPQSLTSKFFQELCEPRIRKNWIATLQPSGSRTSSPIRPKGLLERKRVKLLNEYEI